jgi:hypothetical protein
MLRTTRPTPRFDRSPSIVSSSAVLRASPVRLVDGQHVAIAKEAQALGQLRSLRDARHLLGKDPFGAGHLQVAFLCR